MSKIYEYLPIITACISLLISVVSLFMIERKKEVLNSSHLPEKKEDDLDISISTNSPYKDLNTALLLERVNKDLNYRILIKKKRNRYLIKKKGDLDSLCFIDKDYKDLKEIFRKDFRNKSSYLSTEEVSELIWELQNYKDKILKLDRNFSE